MDARDLPADQRAELEWTELSVAGRRMRIVVGVPIGTVECQSKNLATEEVVIMEEAAELLRMIVKMEDVQASLQGHKPMILHVGIYPIDAPALRSFAVNYNSTTRGWEDFDTLLDGALSSMIGGGGNRQGWAGEPRGGGE